MASGPIASWQVDGETVETVTDFIFGGSKITAGGDYSHEIKRCLLFGRKAMTNLNNILKRGDITLPTKVCLFKAIVFPVVMYGCKSWTIKKAECQRIDAFDLWCWRRLLRVPWTARRSNQSILKKSVLNIHWKDWCWSWNFNIWPPDGKTDSLEKTLMLRKVEGRRRRGWQRMRRLHGITDMVDMIWVSSRRWWWTGKPGVLQSMELQRVGHDWETVLTDKVNNFLLEIMHYSCGFQDTKLFRFYFEPHWSFLLSVFCWFLLNPLTSNCC